MSGITGRGSVAKLPKFKVESKVWKKFTPDVQENLLKRYDVILLNHETRKEKAVRILESIDITSKKGMENFDKYFKKVDDGFAKFDDAMDEFDKAWAKAFPQSKKKTELIDLKDIKI